MPEFHSPAIFNALLDAENGGYCTVQPTQPFVAKQQYSGLTNILETTFETADGIVTIADFFVVQNDVEKATTLFPDHEILRCITGLSGTVEMTFAFRPVLAYGKKKPVLRNFKKMGVHFYCKENTFVLNTTLPNLEVVKNVSEVQTRFSVDAGATLWISFSNSTQHPAVVPELAITAAQRLHQTRTYWNNWSATCSYEGFYRTAVLRSALALKLLTHAPTGAIVAAATTSLPEKEGGDKNWDYRYCWLRDASFTVRALLNLGFYNEVHAYMNWIIHATRLTHPRLQVMYNVFGIAKLKEKVAHWLPGYRQSRPVHIGNAAYQQHQLDVYGEVLDAVSYYARALPSFDRSTKKFVLGLGKTICKRWQEKDDGIWEKRSGGAHYTHSKVMCWVGLDRILQLAKKYNWNNASIKKFRTTKAQIEHIIETQGFNKALNSYVDELNGTQPDMALLTLPLVGYCEANSSKMIGTVEYHKNHLFREGYIYRYPESLHPLHGEGAFLIGNFWLIENYIQSNHLQQAKSLFDATLASINPQGLLTEEIDPPNYWLGNYPQAFSHIGLINAAVSLTAASKNKNHL